MLYIYRLYNFLLKLKINFPAIPYETFNTNMIQNEIETENIF